MQMVLQMIIIKKSRRNRDVMKAEELFDKYTNFAYKIAHKYSNYSRETEDIKQQALMGLWVASKEYDASKGFPFMSFANVVINNQILIYLRKVKKHVGIQSLDKPMNEQQHLIDITADNKDYILELEEQLDLEKIKQIACDENLQGKDIKAFRLLLQGKTQKEVASQMKIAQPTVARMKQRAIKKIQKIYMNKNRGGLLQCKMIKD